MGPHFKRNLLMHAGIINCHVQAHALPSCPMKVLSSALTLAYVAVLLCFAPCASMAQNLKWRYATGVSSFPVLGPDGTLYVGSGDGYIYAIVTVGNSSVAAGSLKWRYATGGQVLSSPVLGPDGTLYVGSYDSYIYAIVTVGISSVAAGSLKWRYLTG